MEISMLLHPSEWQRAWQLFFDSVEKDLELRFPETRRRFALELKQELSDDDIAAYQNVIRRFHSAKRVVSAFDWPLLVEWNERKEQAQCVSIIRFHLDEYPELDNQEFQIISTIRARLVEIRERILSCNLPRDPQLWRCLKTRFELMFLRDEARYLCKRLAANWTKFKTLESA